MNIRNVERVIIPQSYHWVGNGFHVTPFIGSFPAIDRRRMDPFIMLDYNAPVEFKPSESPRGVGGHPHKGFETVTLAYQGKVAHGDSKGNYGVIGEGDVQWMTAGAGIMHKEYIEEEWNRKGGIFQMVQLWVNLPAKDKETPAHYQDLKFEQMTKVNLPGNAGLVDVIAGAYQGHQGSAHTYSPMHIYNIRLNKDGETAFSLPNHYNTALLTISGSVKLNDNEELLADSFALLENGKGESFTLKALEENTVVLLISGEPLNEPIAQYGPFVMNTQEQLQQAFEDFNSGKFGNV
jgi:redox-sensitive bicupin YhaK (pirin superfamily)